MNLNYFYAIQYLRPGAQIAVFCDGNYEDIDWGNETPIPQEELDTAIPATLNARAAKARRMEITQRLSTIDLESIRALRAKTVDKGKPQDDTKLATLDTEADALRAELTTLQA